MLVTSRSFVLSAVTLAALSFRGVGCSNSRRGGNGSVELLASGTAAPIGSQGLVPGGGLEGLNDGSIQFPEGSQFVGPAIQIHSPARGENVKAGRVPVAIQVTDKGKGVQSVIVNGQGAQVDAQGMATVEVFLEAGMRTIVVEATDSEGTRSERHVSVWVGDLSKEGALVDEAAAVRLTDEAIDFFEPSVATTVEGQRDALRQQVLTSKPPKDTKFTSFDFGAVQSQLDATTGGVRFRLEIANVALGIEYKAKFLLFFSKKKRGTVKAGTLVIEGLATPSLDPATGKLSSSVSNVTAAVQNFTVPDWADSAKNDLRKGFQDQFSQAAAQGIDKALNDALAKTQTQGDLVKSAFGKSIKATWQLRGLTCDDEGINAHFAAAIQAEQPTYGSDEVLLVGTPSAPLGGTGGQRWNGSAAVHQDTINQALHALWRHGVLSFTVDQSTFDQINPLSQVRLDTDALIAAQPELEQVLPAGTPIDLDIEAQMAPYANVVAGLPHQLELSLGAVRVSWRIQDPVSGAIVTLAETVYSLKAEASLQDDQGKIKLVQSGNVEVHVDVEGNPLPGSEPLVEQVTAQLAPQLVQSTLDSLPGFAIPAVKGFTMSGLDFYTYDDGLVLTGTLQPATQP